MDRGGEVVTKVPDLWYDLYVRILPGVYLCIGCYLFIVGPIQKLPPETGLSFLLIGYLVGHALQPLSERGTVQLFEKLGINLLREKIYRDKSFDTMSRPALVLSKEHAEVSSMFALSHISACLVVLTLALMPLRQYTVHDNGYLAIAAVVFLLLFGIFRWFANERALSYKTRIERVISSQQNGST